MPSAEVLLILYRQVSEETGDEDQAYEACVKAYCTDLAQPDASACEKCSSERWRCCGCSGFARTHPELFNCCSLSVPCPDCLPWAVCAEFARFNTYVRQLRSI